MIKKFKIKFSQLFVKFEKKKVRNMKKKIKIKA